MSYGDGKRSQVARDFGLMNITGFGLASAIGIGSAVIVDLVQQQEASSLYVINRLLLEATTLLGINAIPLYGVMLLLMGAGALSIFVTEPVSYRGAFTQGFLVLSALVTAVPSDLGTPLQAPAQEMRESDEAFDSMFEPASLSGGEMSYQIVPVAVQRSGQQEYQLRIQVNFPNGLEGNLQGMVKRNRLVGKLWNPDTNTRYNIFRNSGAEISYRDNKLRIVTTVDAIEPESELWILVEANGYKITEERFEAQVGPNPIWNVNMQPSNTPLLVQRLRHPYRF
ncbi:hypothetical protein HK107_13640 [Parvularcula sp. ZS-1/3]|uniref:Uncharacterized protein n=1 Tax=Parvularcula mediterranea TaxID=2732508 RepID=A0A7Y3RNI9_9PROT|nr:hypothetical protein [Parvularcula mediterranea]NNU17369.1 hypothetical protein [Parvularcula mediterranea]